MLSLNLLQVFRIRDRLILTASRFIGTVINHGDQMDELVRAVAAALPPRHQDEATLVASLMHLGGIKPLERQPLVDTCWRLAGNLSRIRREISVTPWLRQAKDEWVPLQIISIRSSNNRRGELGYTVRTRALAGTPCPMILTRFWSKRFASFAARKFGFSHKGISDKADRDIPFRRYSGDARSMVNFRFWGLVSRIKSLDGPVVTQMGISGGFQRWNQRLIDLRERRKPGCQCPHGQPDTLACTKCPFGYLECPAGTHRQNYEQRPCPECKEPLALFDPESASSTCVECYARWVLAKARAARAGKSI